MARSLDWIGAWAEATERELGEEAFQRDVALLGKIVPLMALWSRYFDGEVRGIERIPSGPVLLVGNHSGGILTPDTSVFFAAWYRAKGLESPLIALAFDGAFGIPQFRELMRKIGEVPANRRNASPVLVYPGGDHECFRPWTDRGRIDFAGRKGFVELALGKQVPVVPVVSHGGHHSTYIVTRGDWLGPLLGSERIRTTTFPLALQIPWGLSPIMLPGVPLPAKITIDVGEPMPWSAYGPDAANDPAIVARCYHEITGCMQATLDRLAAEHPYPVLSRLRRLLPSARARRGR